MIGPRTLAAAAFALAAFVVVDNARRRAADRRFGDLMCRFTREIAALTADVTRAGDAPCR